MSKYETREAHWESMSENQRALAYYNTLLADARQRDKLFPKENNLRSLRHEMKVTYVYGQGD